MTDEQEIRELINKGGARFYIGYDPTANSLHIGHFMTLCLMKRLQMAGNKPVVLLGGGTGFVGDPSGKTDMRTMMTPETIKHNCVKWERRSKGSCGLIRTKHPLMNFTNIGEMLRMRM